MPGKTLILFGVILVLVGAAWSVAPWLFQRFGRLPGDIRIERANGTLFIPITSMIVVSVLLTIVLNLFLRR